MRARTEADAFVAAQEPIEWRMARQIVRRVVFVGPIVVVGLGLVRGWAGAWSAAAGVGIVVFLYLITGLIMSRAARISLTALQAAAMIGFVVRLGLIAGAMYGLAAVAPVDRLALGVSTVVAYLALLVWEVAAMTGDDRR